MTCIVSVKERQLKLSSKNNKVKENFKDVYPLFHFMEKKDFIWMVILMLAFFVLAIINLGDSKEPETYLNCGQDGIKEVVLDLGEYKQITNLDFFLGCKDNINVALSVYDEDEKEWFVLDDSMSVSSVFAWNRRDINFYGRYMGLVFTDPEALVNELVLLDSDGNEILPYNADEYTELFDEQQIHPEYISYKNGTIFDEVYHGRTAYEFINHRTAYETTHPHLGKILIALGIRIFGMNPFGMRISSVVMGTLMLGFVYLFAKRLTKDTMCSAFATALLCVDFMHFALSRIGTIDVHVAFFIIGMYYFMFAYLQENKKRIKYSYLLLCLSGCFMGLGCATKFTGIFAGAGLGVIFTAYLIKNFPKDRWVKLMILCIVSFIVVPLIIYTLGFIPVVEYVKTPNLITKMITGTKNMISYHSGLNATHSYSSKWYTWPFTIRPLLDAYNVVADDKRSSISTMGNPIIWWFGFLCLIYTTIRIFVKKDMKALFLVVAYLTQYMPWWFVSRICFIYHYFPSSIFLIVIIGYTMKTICDEHKWGKCVVYGFLGAATALFFIYYPAISGMPVKYDYLKALSLFESWTLT